MEQAIGFEELHWLQELNFDTHKKVVPVMVRALLLKRGLIEEKRDGLMLTTRGRIALAKLG